MPGINERIEIIVNIEIQNNDKPGYPIPSGESITAPRMVLFPARHLFRDQEYGKLKKVVSIWICENHSEDDAIRLLSSMFSPTRTAEDKKKDTFGRISYQRYRRNHREVRRMCNLSAGILEKGIELGIEKGTLETLFALVKQGIISISVAAKQVSMEPNEFEKRYRNYLG